VTSRSPLYVTWEHLLRVPPLALPHAYTPATCLDRLVEVPSVALLLQRARAAGTNIAVTTESAAPLVELVRRSDGLPLAIELLAERLAMLTPAEVLERSATDWADEVSILRDLPSRHQSLRAALEWSYALLNPREQAVFRQLAVFVGSWTLDGAVAVAADPTDSPEVVSAVLRALIDAGLIVATKGRETRYRFLETTRRYASRLSSNALHEVSARHRWRAYVLDLVRGAERAFQTGDQASRRDWVARLSGYWPDLRALMQQCFEEALYDTAVEVVLNLWRFWRIQGSGAEALTWLSSALAQSDIPTRLRIRALILAGELTGRYGDCRRARELLNEGIRLAREHADREHEAIAVTERAGVAIREGDPAGALDDYDNALAISRTTAQDTFVGAVLAAYVQHAARVDTGRGDGVMSQALSVADKSPDLDSRALILFARAELAARSGQPELAITALEPALSFALSVGSARLLSRLVEAVTVWPLFHTNPSFAAEVLGAVGALREKLGLPPMDDEPEWLSAVRYLEGKLGHGCFRASFESGTGRTEQELIAAVCAFVRNAHADAATRDATLSEREQEVLRLVAEGKTSKQIGLDLAIAERTVKAHVTNILNKLGVMTRAQALAVAVRQGLI
jgi:predicted ATPase/DNA-binding CsgD family transcriptional regulator